MQSSRFSGPPTFRPSTSFGSRSRRALPQGQEEAFRMGGTMDWEHLRVPPGTAAPVSRPDEQKMTFMLQKTEARNSSDLGAHFFGVVTS